MESEVNCVSGRLMQLFNLSKAVQLVSTQGLHATLVACTVGVTMSNTIGGSLPLHHTLHEHLTPLQCVLMWASLPHQHYCNNSPMDAPIPSHHCTMCHTAPASLKHPLLCCAAPWGVHRSGSWRWEGKPRDSNCCCNRGSHA